MFLYLQQTQIAGTSSSLYYHWYIERYLPGPRLIAVPKGNNVKNWKIRSQVSKSANCKDTRKVQRLNVFGLKELTHSFDSLRYSLVPVVTNVASTDFE
jgi:hypothetical protein